MITPKLDPRITRIFESLPTVRLVVGIAVAIATASLLSSWLGILISASIALFTGSLAWKLSIDPIQYILSAFYYANRQEYRADAVAAAEFIKRERWRQHNRLGDATFEPHIFQLPEPIGSFSGHPIYEWIGVRGMDGRLYYAHFNGIAADGELPLYCFFYPHGVIYSIDPALYQVTV